MDQAKADGVERVMRTKKHSLQEELAAETAYEAINPDDSDETIAAIVADWLTTRTSQPPYRLGIFHDVRPSAERNFERSKKYFPDRKPYQPYGRCPLEFDWQRKNTVGINTLDRERARQWAIDAMLLGYAVFKYWGLRSGGGSSGSLAEVRERARRSGARPKIGGASS
jgi:hypothetical protein